MSELKEFEQTLKAINNLNEDDAKALLKIMYRLIDTAMTGNGGDEVKLEIMKKIAHMFKKIPNR